MSNAQNTPLERLVVGLESTGVSGRGMNSRIAEKTGYTLSMVGKVLSGKVEMGDRFTRLVCNAFGINEKWVLEGKEPVVAKSVGLSPFEIGGTVSRERGNGRTPPRVVELLKKEVSDKSILAVSKATGLGLAAIGRYMKGIGEPTTASLEKLADYFQVSVPWLRGEGAVSCDARNVPVSGIYERKYIVEFKVGDQWIQTQPIGPCDYSSEASGALLAEKILHDAGLKARVVLLTTDREIIGG